jgi:hypothetical protein
MRCRRSRRACPVHCLRRCRRRSRSSGALSVRVLGVSRGSGPGGPGGCILARSGRDVGDRGEHRMRPVKRAATHIRNDAAAGPGEPAGFVIARSGRDVGERGEHRNGPAKRAATVVRNDDAAGPGGPGGCQLVRGGRDVSEQCEHRRIGLVFPNTCVTCEGPGGVLARRRFGVTGMSSRMEDAM